jgi:streptomycin 6-kinase
VTTPPGALREHARRWRVTIDNIRETDSSWIAYGRRRELPVVLKAFKRPNDEWRSGEILAAFEGRGAVQVYEHVPGALLMERLSPGTALVELSLNGRDDEATEILADVIGRMSAREPTRSCPTVADWGRSFTADTAGNISVGLVREAQEIFEELARSQVSPSLLHGDLHHYNVLFDRDRDWLAIDPKGVVGEIEYEFGAALRNPVERPDLFADARTVEKRLNVLAARLRIDAERVLRWTFAQAVLAALWKLEDGADLTPQDGFIRLAEEIRPMFVL